jgi:hypothetical protein
MHVEVQQKVTQIPFNKQKVRVTQTLHTALLTSGVILMSFYGLMITHC